ncbi:MAG: beta-ketoacyl synthase, partial [Henriciella sp.]
PGIKTIDAVADDVHQDRLSLGPEHQTRRPEDLTVAILNSKGFGGNNASAVILSPDKTEAMLAKRYGDDAMTAYYQKREPVLAASQAYLERADRGDFAPIYRFGEDRINEADIEISETRIKVAGLANAIALPTKSPYSDMIG